VLWYLFRRAYDSRDPVEAALAMWLLVGVPVLIYLNLPCKYLTVAAPAAALLVVRAARESVQGTRVLAWASGLGAVSGLLVLVANANFGAFEKNEARALVQRYQAEGRRVWFGAHWGFQWYAEHLGATALTVEDHPQPGDVIIREPWTDFDQLRKVRARRLIAKIEKPGPNPLRVHGSGGGFYSDSNGYLPWWGGPTWMDKFEVWEVVKQSRTHMAWWATTQLQ
jgi:hypothetical protein